MWFSRRLFNSIKPEPFRGARHSKSSRPSYIVQKALLTQAAPTHAHCAGEETSDMPVWGDKRSLWLCPVWTTRLQIPRDPGGRGGSLARTMLSPVLPPRPPPPALPHGCRLGLSPGAWPQEPGPPVAGPWQHHAQRRSACPLPDGETRGRHEGLESFGPRVLSLSHSLAALACEVHRTSKRRPTPPQKCSALPQASLQNGKSLPPGTSSAGFSPVLLLVWKTGLG